MPILQCFPETKSQCPAPNRQIQMLTPQFPSVLQLEFTTVVICHSMYQSISTDFKSLCWQLQLDLNHL